MNEIRKANIFMLSVIIYMIVISLAFPVAVVFLSDEGMDFELSNAWLLILSQFLSQVIPFVAYVIVSKKKLSEILPFRSIGFTNVIFIFIMAILIQPLMMLLSAISNLFFTNTTADVLSSFSEDNSSMLIGFLIISIIPSICEEAVYRGIIFSGYKKAPIIVIAIVNGIFFAVMHLNPQQFLYAFALGIIFSYVLHYTKSIFSTMLFHFVINGSQSFLMFLILGLNDLDLSEAETAIEADLQIEPAVLSVIVFSIIAYIVTALFVFVFIFFIKHNKKRNALSLSETKVETETDDMEFSIKSVFLNVPFIATIVLYSTYIFLLYFYI